MTAEPGAKQVSRSAAEIVAALATLGLGSAVVIGATQYGIGWTDAGPEPGTFPFYVGLIVAVSSAGNLYQAWRSRRVAGVFVDATQARRIAAFVVPMLLFVAASLALGFYVATALYLCLVMRLQGGYRWVVSITVAIGTSLFFYVVLEIWFKVPLLKGPVEALLGVH